MAIQDPLFLHEEVLRMKASAQRYYKDTLAQADNIAKREPMYNAAREAVVELQHLGYDPTMQVYCYSGVDINIHLKRDDHIKDSVNTIMDTMEEVFQDTTYELDTDETKQDSSYYYVNYKDDGVYNTKIRLEIYIASSEKCRRVKTQEMQTVSTYVCDEEE